MREIETCKKRKSHGSKPTTKQIASIGAWKCNFLPLLEIMTVRPTKNTNRQKGGRDYFIDMLSFLKNTILGNIFDIYKHMLVLNLAVPEWKHFGFYNVSNSISIMARNSELKNLSFLLRSLFDTAQSVNPGNTKLAEGLRYGAACLMMIFARTAV